MLDATAAIALLRDEPAAARVEQLLRDDRARMCTINAAETVDVLVRRYGWPAGDVIVEVEELLSTVAHSVPATLEIATKAGALRARQFRRDQRASLADCFVLATAEPGERIVTGDRTLAEIARSEGFDVVALDA